MKYWTNEYFENLMDIVSQYGGQNYEYYFLSYMHEINRIKGVETIIVGSSYGMDGIRLEYLDCGESAINLSIQSQDIYYDYVNIKKAVEEGHKPIQNCIIAPGYYALYQDLSLSQREKRWIRKVYEPLWGDLHHMEPVKTKLDRFQGINIDYELYPREMLSLFCEHWIKGVIAESGRNFFGGLMKRADIIPWYLLKEEQKETTARDRADQHNRLYVHKEACLENKSILMNMIKYLSGHNIIPIFVIFPFTDIYRQYLNPLFKDELFQCMEDSPYPVKLFDMNDTEEFNDEDFHDCDHLSDKGAAKATRLLNTFLQI